MFHRGRQDGTDVPSVPSAWDRAGGGHSDTIWFYVASRGHHAEIGGISPGSMPSASTRVEEEGVLIDNWLLVHDARLREAETMNLLTTAVYPSRDPATNLADLRAQIAANEKGIDELRAMVDHFGLDVVQAYMGHVQENAAESVRRVITALHDGQYNTSSTTARRSRSRSRSTPRHRTAEIDFTGTSPQLDDNFNAPSSVAMAAVLYVFRTLVDDDIPLNSGCLQPLNVIIPPGTMLSPRYPAAVAAGNVETSQVVTGALYAALGVMAEGSGTMNNVTFGNDRYQYYETVASGSGAGDGFDGTDVVQTKMTNSRLTDPEVLEWRYPVLLESYRIRPGSGGAGRWHGGNGGIRRLRFHEPMTVTTLTGHRRIPAFGMAGGQPGALGRHWIEHPDGTVTPMHGCDSVQVRPGDVFVIRDPGRRRLRPAVTLFLGRTVRGFTVRATAARGPGNCLVALLEREDLDLAWGHPAEQRGQVAHPVDVGHQRDALPRMQVLDAHLEVLPERAAGHPTEFGDHDHEPELVAGVGTLHRGEDDIAVVIGVHRAADLESGHSGGRSFSSLIIAAVPSQCASRLVGVEFAQHGDERGLVSAGVVEHGHQRVQHQVPVLAGVEQPLGRLPQLGRVAAPEPVGQHQVPLDVPGRPRRAPGWRGRRPAGPAGPADRRDPGCSGRCRNASPPAPGRRTRAAAGPPGRRPAAAAGPARNPGRTPPDHGTPRRTCPSS